MSVPSVRKLDNDLDAPGNEWLNQPDYWFSDKVSRVFHLIYSEHSTFFPEGLISDYTPQALILHFGQKITPQPCVGQSYNSGLLHWQIYGVPVSVEHIGLSTLPTNALLKCTKLMGWASGLWLHFADFDFLSSAHCTLPPNWQCHFCQLLCCPSRIRQIAEQAGQSQQKVVTDLTSAPVEPSGGCSWIWIKDWSCESNQTLQSFLCKTSPNRYIRGYGISWALSNACF